MKHLDSLRNTQSVVKSYYLVLIQRVRALRLCLFRHKSAQACALVYVVEKKILRDRRLDVYLSISKILLLTHMSAQHTCDFRETKGYVVHRSAFDGMRSILRSRTYRGNKSGRGSLQVYTQASLRSRTSREASMDVAMAEHPY